MLLDLGLPIEDVRVQEAMVRAVSESYAGYKSEWKRVAELQPLMGRLLKRKERRHSFATNETNGIPGAQWSTVEGLQKENETRDV